MKSRMGFVSNSSSTSFYITNHSKETKTLVDFVDENRQLADIFNDAYSDTITWVDLIYSAPQERPDERWAPGEKKRITFGDESGTVIGRVFDYILREGGSSKSFSWEFDEYLR